MISPVTGPDRAPLAGRGLLIVAAVLVAVLVAVSGRYGYHRDELYFIVLGGHPQWGYVDQPPLIPLLAHAAHVVFDGSLVGFRLPTALVAGATAYVAGLIARELGASGRGQVFAAAAWAMSAVTLASGHLMGTTSFDLLCWALVCWTGVRALRDGGRSWLWVGLAAGVGMEVKTLIATGLVALLIGVATAGPRRALASPWLWIGALMALVLAAPNLWWQAANDWPQLEMSSQIAVGESGTSEPRSLFVPFQIVLLSAFLVPVWVLGWWRLAHSADFALWRAFAVAYVVLAVFLIATGGKPYYLCGMYPVLLAAGAQPVVDWAARARVRVVVLATALALGAAGNAYLMLPLIPPGDVAGSPVEAVNYDAGEQIGWPGFSAVFERAAADLSDADRARTVVLAANYGQAGAVDRYTSLPVFSGHNSLRTLGPPQERYDVVLAVGYSPDELDAWFGTVEEVGRTPTPYGLENDEADVPVYLCRDPQGAWRDLWPEMERLG